MPKLLALAPQDGWAFVEHNGSTLLIKPPYKAVNTTQVSLDAIEKAVTNYGFEALSVSFHNWNELLAFIRQKAEASNRASSKAVKSIEQIVSSTFAHASSKLVSNVLNRVEAELVQTAQWKAALQILKSLLQVESVQNDEGNRRHISELITRCAEGVLVTEERRYDLEEEKLPAFEKEFPYAAQSHDYSRIKKLAKTVAENRQIMKIGA